ncbi:methionine--tRNA ligase [Candidatus Woesearchaeota archaeon]|nr:methionine--tRNA ligase [Candidatus Woesearchaeota archaeon]
MVPFKRILITSALPYVNNVPHLGNLIGAVLSADVYARFARSKYGEDNVLYICGADEHGTTTEMKAKEEGLTPQQLCDKYYAIHKDIYDWFRIEFDIFGRTAHPTQVKNAQNIFQKLYENGYIKEDELEQTYDEQAEQFLADRYVEGTCPYCKHEGARGDQCDACGKMLNPKELLDPVSKITGTAPVIKKVKHLFLDLENLQPLLEGWMKKQSIKDDWAANARNVTKGWLKEGLKKRCITRDLKWGIPVPLKGWEDKVLYVWFEAPIGYISITEQLVGEKYKEWWHAPEEVKLVQFMGKDNIPFHTLLFPATLLGTKQPWTLVSNLSSTDYLNYEDGKFSKSKGIGVFGDDAQKTGLPADAYRYYLLSVRPETSDTQFSWHDFASHLNNELVATLGNLVNRTLVFIRNYADSTITAEPAPSTEDEEFWNKVKEKEEQATALLDEVRLRDALKAAMDAAREGNAYFQASQPWKAIKEDPDKAKTSLYYLAHLCKDLAILLHPYLPATSDAIFEQLGTEPRAWDDLGALNLGGHRINEPEHLFKKVEDKEVQALKERFAGKQRPSPEETFKGFDLRVATITKAEQHPDADKLYVETLDVGPLGRRKIVSGLQGHYDKEELVGKRIVLVANLEPAKLRGVTSHGMLLAAEDDEGGVGLVLAPHAKPGDHVALAGVAPQPKERISIKEFFSVTIDANEQGASVHGKPLLAAGKPLVIDKGITGQAR